VLLNAMMIGISALPLAVLSASDHGIALNFDLGVGISQGRDTSPGSFAAVRRGTAIAGKRES
jgi:hypothetical protein